LANIHLLTPAGFRAFGVAAGIKASGAVDVGLLVADDLATAAAMFTSNKVFAAPVEIGRQNVASGRLRGVVVNAGNANACTGPLGLRNAQRMCQAAAGAICCEAAQFLPASTGIIGHQLPMDRLLTGIVAAARDLGTSNDHATAFADCILTTDTRRKTAGTQLKIGRTVAHIGGVCKGGGMIGPRLSLPGRKKAAPHATMLAFLTTDVQIAPPLLRRLLNDAAQDSFNAVTIDAHMSTNDTLLILASGRSGMRITPGRSAASFAKALAEVCQSLARQMVADGEGATKVVRIEVRGAASDRDARAIARAIADSLLVKCAMNGNDPNWGRIISAAGMCDAAFDPARAALQLQGVTVYAKGVPCDFDAGALSQQMKVPQVDVLLTCGLGRAAATVWTCDLSDQYVHINADYHT
jgi:glutamate N-acetyltransferase/amino-acid N-acetyltransferase